MLPSSEDTCATLKDTVGGGAETKSLKFSYRVLEAGVQWGIYLKVPSYSPLLPKASYPGFP